MELATVVWYSDYLAFQLNFISLQLLQINYVIYIAVKVEAYINVT